MYNVIHRTLSQRNVGAEIDTDLEQENVLSSVFVFLQTKLQTSVFINRI